MDVEQLEQLAAVIVTAGIVAGNFLLFTPWRNGEDPRKQRPESLMPQNESVFVTSPKGWMPREVLKHSIAIGHKPAHTHP